MYLPIKAHFFFQVEQLVADVLFSQIDREFPHEDRTEAEIKHHPLMERPEQPSGELDLDTVLSVVSLE